MRNNLYGNETWFYIKPYSTILKQHKGRNNACNIARHKQEPGRNPAK